MILLLNAQTLDVYKKKLYEKCEREGIPIDKVILLF